MSHEAEQPRYKRINIREEVQSRTGLVGRAIDRIGNLLANPILFLALLLLHVAWVIGNLHVIGAIPPWDPYPFPFLATLASALAPFVSLLILMRQHRDVRIGELREELELQIALKTERRTVLLIRLLDELRTGLQLPTQLNPEELHDAKQLLRPQDMMERIRSELDDVEGDHAIG